MVKCQREKRLVGNGQRDDALMHIRSATCIPVNATFIDLQITALLYTIHTDAPGISQWGSDHTKAV